MNSFRDDDTICATATPPGKGGVAVIRVSGVASAEISRKLCPFLPSALESHRVYYGKIESNSNDIDEVLVTYFQKGRSFTGENTIEINCHGSPSVCDQILDALVDAGARVAEPGEFTFRAFMSGRIDLVQAEGVLGMVESESRKASQLSLRQLGGDLSDALADIEKELLSILAHCEANIDFASEDIEIESNSSLSSRLTSVFQSVDQLISGYKVGKAIQDGVQIALVGKPNVGKSSLLNALIGEDKAIVTDVEGTTRDMVEGHIWRKGIKFNFIDTAGIREVTDQVEALGIEKARAKLSEVDLVMLVGDIENDQSLEVDGLSEEVDQIVLLNKSDKLSSDGENKLAEDGYFQVSARTGKGLEKVLSFIERKFSADSSLNQSAVISNARHYEGLAILSRHLVGGNKLIDQQESPDLVAFELMEGLKALQSVLGKKFDDEVLDQVFSQFCLGK